MNYFERQAWREWFAAIDRDMRMRPATWLRLFVK